MGKLLILDDRHGHPAKLRTNERAWLETYCHTSPGTPSWVEGQRLRKSRPWCEVKSRRGAPKRIGTEGFACPNQQCVYFGITDAHIHAF